MWSRYTAPEHREKDKRSEPGNISDVKEQEPEAIDFEVPADVEASIGPLPKGQRPKKRRRKVCDLEAMDGIKDEADGEYEDDEEDESASETSEFSALELTAIHEDGNLSEISTDDEEPPVSPPLPPSSVIISPLDHPVLYLALKIEKSLTNQFTPQCMKMYCFSSEATHPGVS